MQIEMKSYASRNQLAVSQKQVDEALELEWDRRYVTVLGVANRRLYEFRLQTLNSTYEKDEVPYLLPHMLHTFKSGHLDHIYFAGVMLAHVDVLMKELSIEYFAVCFGHLHLICATIPLTVHVLSPSLPPSPPPPISLFLCG
jgi:hypothetical protein